MNMATGIGERRRDERPGAGASPLAIGGDERRMHVRAYNHWVSLLKGRAYPSIEDLDPAGIADFGPHSVLLDFTRGVDDPTFPFLGRALREECGIDQAVTRVAEVPARSLLSRLTDHYLQIIANRAPIGFEAEFVGRRGATTLYRGILMPFSSDDDGIDYIYGVINWKEVADPATQAALAAELAEAVRAAPAPADPVAIWADGPRADPKNEGDAPAPEGLADHLALARDGAEALRAADGRSRAALYEALSRAHDFALAIARDPDGYAELLDDAGIKPQARAPLTPVVKLVFGADHDKTRLTEFATVLGHAARVGVRGGELAEYLGGHAGGIKAIVAEERAQRRTPTPRPRSEPIAARPTLATVSLEHRVAPGEIVILVARGGEDGAVEIVGSVADAKVVAAAARALG
jgi:hypothetical protein